MAELEKLRAQNTTSARMMAELQATNAQLRGAVSAQRSSSSGGPEGSSRGGGASTGSQLAALETLLERRDKEISELRQALAGSGAQLQRLALQGAQITLSIHMRVGIPLGVPSVYFVNEIPACFLNVLKCLPHPVLRLCGGSGTHPQGAARRTRGREPGPQERAQCI